MNKNLVVIRNLRNPGEEPCQCWGCTENDATPLPGHKFCYPVSDEMLAAEEQGKVWRSFTDGKWQWFTA